MTKFLSSLAAGGLVLGLVVQAQALSKSFQWNAVTTCTNGQACGVDKYTLYRSIDGGSTFQRLVDVSGAQTTAADPDVPAGNICYEATASNILGESTRSNRVCFQVPSARPSAPTGLQER